MKHYSESTFDMRQTIMMNAISDCLNEMYSQSQPPTTWDAILEGHKNGTYNENNSPIEQHYLSTDEYISIKEKYLEAYHIKSEWNDDVQLVFDYLYEGGTKDVYIKDEETQYCRRGYEKTPKLIDALTELIGKEHAEIACDKVFELIQNCKDFYQRNIEESQFSFSVMNYSPNSCKDKVQEFWGDKLKIYDTELDPNEEVFVKVTDERLDIWESELEDAESNQDTYFIEEYTRLLQKYNRIKS